MQQAVAYMRCSGRGQIEGDTWERQLKAIQVYAGTYDFEVHAIYRDEGISGKTELEGRDGLTQCLRFVEVHPSVKTVLVESSDRLARDSLVAEIIIREFQKLDVTVIAASGGVNLTSGDDLNPTAKLIRQVLAAIAEFDRCVTVNKLRVARQRVKEKTGRCEGQKAFGSTPEEQSIILDMRMLRERRFTCREIAQEMNRVKVPSRSGLPWHGSTVAKILARGASAQKVSLESQSVVGG
jgi:DNA invertase Pin-like site-specific DNA recombinase